jgi:hypothetical protein
MTSFTKGRVWRQGDNVTGRDGYIARKALAYAIETISHLPERWQERSDLEDMVALLEATTPDSECLRIVARSHIERRGMQIVGGQLALVGRPTAEIIRLEDH